jgi:hypothetical protein
VDMFKFLYNVTSITPLDTTTKNHNHKITHLYFK